MTVVLLDDPEMQLDSRPIRRTALGAQWCGRSSWWLLRRRARATLCTGFSWPSAGGSSGGRRPQSPDMSTRHQDPSVPHKECW